MFKSEFLENSISRCQTLLALKLGFSPNIEPDRRYSAESGSSPQTSCAHASDMEWHQSKVRNLQDYTSMRQLNKLEYLLFLSATRKLIEKI